MGAERCGLRAVAVVGIDGSGKTTQVAKLQKALVERGAHVVVIHPFGWKFLPPRLAHRAPRQSPRRASPKSRQPVVCLISVAELLDIALYLWSAYIRALLVAIVSRRTVWLLSDRSVDDILVKQRRRGALSEPVLAAWYRFSPRPRQTIWLHTNPAVAASRDGEFPLSYYEELHDYYQRVSEQFKWQIVETSDSTPDEVWKQVASSVEIKPRSS